MSMDLETKRAIMQLWENPEDVKLDNTPPAQEGPVDSRSTAKFLAHVKLLEEQNIIKRVQTHAEKDVKINFTTNAKLDALKDVCGITMSTFLDPSRRHNNPMFDVLPITPCGFTDQLGYEQQVNSVWKM